MNEKREQLWDAISLHKADIPYGEPDWQQNINDLVGAWLWWHGHTYAAFNLWRFGGSAGGFNPEAFDTALDIAFDKELDSISAIVPKPMLVQFLRIIRADVLFQKRMLRLVIDAQGIARQNGRNDIAIRLNEIQHYITLCHQIGNSEFGMIVTRMIIRILCTYISELG